MRGLITSKLLPQHLPWLAFVCLLPQRVNYLDLCHFDAEQAFVQSNLEEDVFLRLPRGCGNMSVQVVRLNLSLYGLKQASRSWQSHLLTRMRTRGFEQCSTID